MYVVVFLRTFRDKAFAKTKNCRVNFQLMRSSNHRAAAPASTSPSIAWLIRNLRRNYWYGPNPSSYVWSWKESINYRAQFNQDSFNEERNKSSVRQKKLRKRTISYLAITLGKSSIIGSATWSLRVELVFTKGYMQLWKNILFKVPVLLRSACFPPLRNVFFSHGNSISQFWNIPKHGDTSNRLDGWRIVTTHVLINIEKGHVMTLVGMALFINWD